MGRKRTGTVRLLRNDDHELQWHAKWTRADGTRTEWLPLNPAVAIDEASARAEAARMAPKIRLRSATDDAVETVEEYSKRWCKWREARGLACVESDRTLLRRHVLGSIGALDVRRILA